MEAKLDRISQINLDILEAKQEGFSTKEISDKWHTFGELYTHRCILFAVVCNAHPERAWKSQLHHDDTMFEGNMFIVGVETPKGQYSYHYHMEMWDYFKVKELKNAPEWDGHEPKDIVRLLSLEEV